MRIFSIATRAIGEQYDRLRRSAARTANINSPQKDVKESPDLIREAAVRIEADAAVRANVSVIRSEDERIKHLLDTIA